MTFGAEALSALFGGPPRVIDRAVPLPTRARLVTATPEALADEINVAIGAALDLGWQLRQVTPLAPLHGAERALVLFEQPPHVERRVRPGEPAHLVYADLAHAGAALLTYIVQAWLPKDDPRWIPSPEDDDYVPDESSPQGAEWAELEKATTGHDDEPEVNEMAEA